MRNLSTHIEDQMDALSDDQMMRIKPISIKSSLIRINSNKSEPGHTPPPASPRYKKMSKAHKRKLSDKLDQFLSDRQDAQQLVAKSILFVEPSGDIEQMKKSMQQKREQREKIKKRLKRKLSHDFRPSEQDILERGIKIIPKVDIIQSDQEYDDMNEEIIIYDAANNEKIYLLQHEERDFAQILLEKRQRNSAKLKLALIDRPSPSQMIQKGIISADNVNCHIPTISKYEMLQRYEAELTLKTSENEKCKIVNEQNVLCKKRRIRILSFYDNYLFNTIYDDEEDEDALMEEQYVDIDADYQQILEKVEANHQKLKRNDALFCRKDICLQLYAIKDEQISLEKEWMRNLRKRKFRSYINKNRNRAKRMKREQIEMDLNELMEQVEIVTNSQKVETMNSEVLRLEKQRVQLIENTVKQIDELREIIRTLNEFYSHKTGFISVS